MPPHSRSEKKEPNGDIHRVTVSSKECKSKEFSSNPNILNNLQKLWSHCGFFFLHSPLIPVRKPSSKLERPSEEPGAGTVPCCKHMLPSSAPQPHSSSSANSSVKPQTNRIVDKYSSIHQLSNYKR